VVVRSFGVACLLLLGTAAGVSAQDPGSESPRPLPELVREALNRPADPSAWTGLADALPELALTESADPVTLFEASRVADSLAGAPVAVSAAAPEGVDVDLPAGSGTPTGRRSGLEASLAAMGAGIRGLPAGDLLAWAPWALVALILGVGPFLRGRARRRARSAAEAAKAAAASEERPESAERRHWTVTTLAENGLPPSEIARRTGMAQDAVHVLLGLRSSPAAPASRTRGGSTLPAYLSGMEPTLAGAPATRPPSMGEQAAGIAMARTSLERESRSLRGGRLTYGPER
jgi:hypothetical protein